MTRSFQKVLRSAIESGYVSPSVFVEKTTHARLDLNQKRLDAHFETQVGSCFEAVHQNCKQRLLLGNENPSDLARTLGLPYSDEEPDNTPLHSISTKSLQIFARFLKEKYRSVCQQFPN